MWRAGQLQGFPELQDGRRFGVPVIREGKGLTSRPTPRWVVGQSCSFTTRGLAYSACAPYGEREREWEGLSVMKRLAGERNQVVFTFRGAFVYGWRSSLNCAVILFSFFSGMGWFWDEERCFETALAQWGRGGLVEATMANFVRTFRSLFWVKRLRWGEGVSIESWLSDCCWL